MEGVSEACETCKQGESEKSCNVRLTDRGKSRGRVWEGEESTHSPGEVWEERLAPMVWPRTPGDMSLKRIEEVYAVLRRRLESTHRARVEEVHGGPAGVREQGLESTPGGPHDVREPHERLHGNAALLQGQTPIDRITG